MNEQIKKYKTRESWNEFGHSHYLTFSTFEKRNYLLDERICREISKAINVASKKHDFAVLGYVFMPNHIHMLLHPMMVHYRMAVILRAIKQGPSQRALAKGWIDTNLWMPGGGYDSNVANQNARVEILRYLHQNPVRQNLAKDSTEFRWSSANWYFNETEGEVRCQHIGEVWGELWDRG